MKSQQIRKIIFHDLVTMSQSTPVLFWYAAITFCHVLLIYPLALIAFAYLTLIWLYHLPCFLYPQTPWEICYCLSLISQFPSD